MNRHEKKQLLSLMGTINEAHEYIKNQIENKNYDATLQMLANCQECAIRIGTSIEQSEGEYNDIIKNLEKYNDLLYQLSQSLGDVKSTAKILKQIHKRVDIIENNIKYSIKTQIEVLFLPYKASMWTSLESLWKAADEDNNCNAIVMPIPYYNIGDPKNVTETYEGDMFPKTVPITDYRLYNIEERHPDVIFIHNPYDDNNILTRVHPKFYSSSLKNNTDCLVYSPYFSFGSYAPGKSDFQYIEPGTINADKIIVQSEKVKKIFKTYGFNEDKLIVSGSPKIDAMIGLNKDQISMPEEWKQKLHNRKVFLLNTHLLYFPKSFANKNKSGNYGVRLHDEILMAIVNKEDVGMIWRPHPLLKKTISTKFPECQEYITSFEKNLIESSNCVVDDLGDYRPSFIYSDALISTWSSLINEYMVTGKPTMIFQSQMSEEVAAQSPINRNLNYFRLGSNRIAFEEFVEMVSNDIDPLYEDRMKMIRLAFKNIDGSAGKNAYIRIKSELI